MRSLKYLLFVFIISFISLKAVSAEVCTYSTTMSVSGSQKHLHMNVVSQMI